MIFPFLIELCCIPWLILTNHTQAKIFGALFNNYYMVRACKYITRSVIGQYSGPDFPVMPTGIMNDVNARHVKREYRKRESTFNSNSSTDLKLNEKRQFL